MSIQLQGIQRMEVNITKKDSFDHHGLGITDRNNLFTSLDSQGNAALENEGLAGWQQ